MTNIEQAEQYMKKQVLINRVMVEFEYCRETDEVAIHQNNKYIWTEQEKEIIIPSFVSVIYSEAFKGCTFIEKITFKNPDKIVEIRGHAFENCRSLKEIEIPPNIVEIESYAFRDCRSLRSIEIPDKVRKLGTEAFSYCESLERIKLSANMNEIGMQAFMSCRNIKNIDIPNSVREIGMFAFFNCKNLELVNIDAVNSEIENMYGYEFNGCEHLTNMEAINVIKERINKGKQS